MNTDGWPLKNKVQSIESNLKWLWQSFDLRTNLMFEIDFSLNYFFVACREYIIWIPFEFRLQAVNFILLLFWNNNILEVLEQINFLFSRDKSPFKFFEELSENDSNGLIFQIFGNFNLLCINCMSVLVNSGIGCDFMGNSHIIVAKLDDKHLKTPEVQFANVPFVQEPDVYIAYQGVDFMSWS